MSTDNFLIPTMKFATIASSLLNSHPRQFLSNCNSLFLCATTRQLHNRTVRQNRQGRTNWSSSSSESIRKMFRLNDWPLRGVNSQLGRVVAWFCMNDWEINLWVDWWEGEGGEHCSFEGRRGDKLKGKGWKFDEYLVVVQKLEKTNTFGVVGKIIESLNSLITRTAFNTINYWILSYDSIKLPWLRF